MPLRSKVSGVTDLLSGFRTGKAVTNLADAVGVDLDQVVEVPESLDTLNRRRKALFSKLAAGLFRPAASTTVGKFVGATPKHLRSPGFTGATTINPNRSPVQAMTAGQSKGVVK